ncbi:TPA: GNAT family N-acetyltransferase [Legionella pneumophila]|nr:GNAT family N-acetyltransferase [Legionella pneumophila]HAT8181499.1 GNAT family N-acetyltransferase [Legionella pneumophila]
MTTLLETLRLVIKAPTLNDISHWYLLHSDPDVMQYMGGTRDKYVIQEWLDYDILHYKKHGFAMGSVYEKNNNKFIGVAGLVYLDHDDTQPDVEIGYVLHKKYWRQGYGTEIVDALINWGFTHLKVNKLVAVTRSENTRSRCLLERCGMQYTKITTFHEEEFLQYEIHRL